MLGENLIFLVSQPRSGSTLLQYMLAGHPRIHTLPEPWFMLHLLYANRPHGLAAEYDARTAHQALADFLAAVEGDQPFTESVRAAAAQLYGQALKGSGSDLFLDKTPRYYLIVEDLREVFPRARMILLIRNPLSVLSSILHTYANGDWSALRRVDRMHDLVTAPRNIVHAMEQLGGDRTAIVHYEELVNDPDTVLTRICDGIEIEDVPDLKTYVATESLLGDAKSRKHHAPVTDYVDQWKHALDSPVKRNIASSYLNELGPALVHRLGYEYGDLMGQLAASHSNKRTSSRWEMLTTPDERLPWWHRVYLGIVHSRHRRGIMKTVLRLAYMTLRGHAQTRPNRRARINGGPI